MYYPGYNEAMVNAKGTRRTCSQGHTYYKSTDCVTCPFCEAGRKPKDGILSLLAAPARRALESKNIRSLNELSGYTEEEIKALHGIGPSSIPKLKAALQKENLSFKRV